MKEPLPSTGQGLSLSRDANIEKVVIRKEQYIVQVVSWLRDKPVSGFCVVYSMTSLFFTKNLRFYEESVKVTISTGISRSRIG